jgi:hypothetical protein
MTKIVVSSPSLTQPLLLYPGLGPAMLDNIGDYHYVSRKSELSGGRGCVRGTGGETLE